MSLKAFFIGLSIIGLTSTAYAKPVDLYEQPDTHSKQIGKIDPEKGFVPIFSKKEGDWVKVGDPINGNTGWVKSNDLAQDTTSTRGFSFSQSVISNGKGPQSWVVQFGAPKPMDLEQSTAYWKQMMAQQDALQRDMQKITRDMFEHSQNSWINFPMMMPIVMLPIYDSSHEKSKHKKP